MDSPLFIGVYLPSHKGSCPESVETALKGGFDMVASRILSKSFIGRVQSQVKRSASPAKKPFQNSSSLTSDQSNCIRLGENDTLIKPGLHISSTIGISSPWIELDSKDESIRQLGLNVLENEAAYAAFCGINYLIVPGPKRRNSALIYAQALSKVVAKHPNVEFSVHVQFCEEFADQGSPHDYLSIWELWNTIRSSCNNVPNLKVALQMPASSSPVPDYVLSRWYAESVSMLIVPNSCFIPNQKKYPVFPKWAQALFHRFVKSRPFVIVESLDNLQQQPEELHSTQPNKSDTSPQTLRTATSHQSTPEQPEAVGHATSPMEGLLPHTGQENCQPARVYAVGANENSLPDKTKNHQFSGGADGPLIYLRYLFQHRPEGSMLEKFAKGFEDVLQTPLHPLMDSLDSRTYEVFEKDPVKYDQYEKSLVNAMTRIRDWNAAISHNQHDHIPTTIVDSKAAETVDLCVSVAVVGAGRGGIVDRVIKAAESVGCNVRIFALEKNQCAYAYMLNRPDSKWKDLVRVVFSDMRTPPPDLPKVDIVVSELLGSLGDNELAPECLAGIRNLLKNPCSGIVIPESHTSLVAPVFSPLLHSRAKAKSLETPYVVMMDHSESVSRNVKAAWKFDYTYPNCLGTASSAFSRSAKLTFVAPHRSVVHGIAGFFESTLIDDIELSTCPSTQFTKSRDLVSWFPLYLPLSIPLLVPDNSQIDVYLWRHNNGRIVWYEWAAEVFATLDSGSRLKIGSSIIHNSMGATSSMSL